MHRLQISKMIICLAGDIPAKNFEGGQMGPSGKFLCICGTPAANFQNAEKVLRSPPFTDLADRITHFGIKSPSYVYDIAAMKVCNGTSFN